MSVPMNAPTNGPEIHVGDVQAAFATTLVDEWVRSGVVHAVVCPGSRSTPLALAIAADPRLVVHVRLDERSAAFTALGIGMATGMPAVIVVTSGTAAAELHPAVVEADLAGVPLLVCTADRPPELHDVGAPQTIDQTNLYGGAVRWFAEPGVPDLPARSTWRSLGARSVAEAVAGSRGPGPVHLNLAFREPLLGDADLGGVPPGRRDGGPWHRVDTGVGGPSAGLLEDLVASGLAPGTRGLIVAGAGCGDPSSVLALADALSWPVVADPRSGLRGHTGHTGHVVVSAADAVLRSTAFVASHRPDLVLSLGDRWASKVVTSFTTSSSSVVVDPFGRWRDPEHAAVRLVRCDPSLLCRGLTEVVADGGHAGVHADDPWLAGWRRAESVAREVIDRELAAGPWSEPALAYRLLQALAPDTHLVVSSSMPVRDVEAFGAPRDDPPRVLANRGANGIDGVVSTALGVSLAAGPTVALVGDLAFLHDVSALVRGGTVASPLIVVVADNGGGGIFSFLPPATALDVPVFERIFGTPQVSDVASVAAGFGWTVEEIDPQSGSSALADALERATARGDGTVIRVGLPDRGTNVDLHARLNAAIVTALDDTVPV